jgi:hypothetical protein
MPATPASRQSGILGVDHGVGNSDSSLDDAIAAMRNSAPPQSTRQVQTQSRGEWRTASEWRQAAVLKAADGQTQKA